MTTCLCGVDHEQYPDVWCPEIRPLTSDQFRDWRKAHGLTQKQVAARLGRSTSCISHWEQGTQTIPRRVWLELDALERMIQRVEWRKIPT